MPPIAVLVALADPTRCRIIEILRDGAQPVHVLAASFDISRPAISRHLRVLKQARLISEKKAGRENRYALHPGRLKPVREWLVGFDKPAEPTEPARPQPEVAPAPIVPELPPATIFHEIVPPPALAPKLVREKPTSQMGFDF